MKILDTELAEIIAKDYITSKCIAMCEEQKACGKILDYKIDVNDNEDEIALYITPVKSAEYINVNLNIDANGIKFISHDMNKKPCIRCKDGVYGENTIYDDWEGTYTCNRKECGHSVPRNMSEYDYNKEKTRLIC